MFTSVIRILALVTALLLAGACTSEGPTVPAVEEATPSPDQATATAEPSPPSFQEFPPCTPLPDSPVDPCEPDASLREMGMAQSVPELGGAPLSLHEMLDDRPPPAWVTHLVVRGTYLPGTVRCTSGDLFHPPPYLSDEFVLTANSRAFKCYADVRANSYMIGTGPSTLTALVFKYLYWDHEYSPSVQESQTVQATIEENRQLFETHVSSLFSGREHIVFLGPPVDLSSEAWRLMGYWDVQRQEDNSIVVVHPERDLWRRLRPDDYQTHRAALEMTLPALTQAVTTAHQERVAEYDGRIGADEDLPDLVTNANELRDYYTEVGAYDEGAPPPSQPPPPCGLAVPDQPDCRQPQRSRAQGGQYQQVRPQRSRP